MKRQYSLKGRNSFKEIYKKGKNLKVKGLRIIVLKNRNSMDLSQNLKNSYNDSGIRIGITIDRKVGKAFIRNKLKRRIKTICHEILDEIKNDNWIVIRPGSDALDYNYIELKNNIRQLLKKTGVID